MKFRTSSVKKYSLPLILIAVFVVAGVALLHFSHAATPFASLEAENGTKTNATTVADTSASAGSAVKFVQATSTQPGSCSGTAPGTYAYSPMAGRGWPTTYGQGYIATWKDDKIAVATLTIDDNILADHAYWKQQQQATGFKFTWFVITYQGSDGKLQTGATWNDFRTLYGLGNSIQSHTVTHSSPVSDNEYKQSQIDIQREIGVKPVTVAYPDGDDANAAGAAKYYIAARGTVGFLNTYKPDYYHINSFSTNMNMTDPNNYNYAPAVIDKSFTQDSNPDYYRGWISIHYHSIATDKPMVASEMNWLTAHKADIWVAGFDDAALYAHERDSAQLNVTAAGNNCVAFNVTDGLDNATYNYPLTVKIRLQDTSDWSSVSAKQNGKAVAAKIVTNGSNKYAQVDAVPDAGPVILSN